MTVLASVYPTIFIYTMCTECTQQAKIAWGVREFSGVSGREGGDDFERF